MVAARQEVNALAAAEKVPLYVETVLAQAETWLACNTAVSDTEIGLIGAAWTRALDSGELRTVYANSGILSLYPGQ